MKKLFKIFIALIISLSMVLLVSCGEEPSDKIKVPQGPPLPPEEETPMEWPSDWENVEGPMVDYNP